jgi:hypothetical protein
MFIILQTQYRENYGAHDWNGEGECPQYWKNKGGDAYVIEGVSATQHAEFPAIVERAISHFGCVYASEYSEEYLIDWHACEDHERPWEEWETPKRVDVGAL